MLSEALNTVKIQVQQMKRFLVRSTFAARDETRDITSRW